MTSTYKKSLLNRMYSLIKIFLALYIYFSVRFLDSIINIRLSFWAFKMPCI